MAGQSGFDLTKFNKFVRQINKGSAGGGPYAKVFNRWGKRYLSWTEEQYKRNSQGGGEWPPLAQSTLTYKRVTGKNLRRTRGGRRRSYKQKNRLRATRVIGAGSVKILSDTGTLLTALTPGAPGNLFRYIKNGVRVGFGGPAKHPDGKATIRDIAVFHDQGKGRVPRRQILHKPDNKLVQVMLKDLADGIEKTGKAL